MNRYCCGGVVALIGLTALRGRADEAGPRISFDTPLSAIDASFHQICS
jgi:hypothetical protein